MGVALLSGVAAERSLYKQFLLGGYGEDQKILRRGSGVRIA